MRQRTANILLVKDNVGKSKPSTRDLPGNYFTYGKPEIRDIEGVGDGKYSLCLRFQFRKNGSTTSTLTLAN